ncbi:hypothetical protein P389DRAFT_210615 [Cystobasidium minutum MCA 4210]|uniref:uncharacterized protein n=1 Tax=Cystobasidium minutum MCA 4210 TaxID=1397322 RepID=UPI0034CE72F7|eukprot:jgi/Rhomi1/210615/estExt_Genemark1.C_4_t10169
MSFSEESGICTSSEEVLTCSPWSTVRGGQPQSKLDVQELHTKLGVRTTRRPRSSSSSSSLRHASKIRTASNSRKIKVIGRFASPQRSREVSPTLSLDDSSDSDSCHTARASRPGLDSQNDADMEIDPNDADDEAESKAMDMRGRTRRTRQISLSRHL